MPIYEYLCQKCGEFEVTQKITANSLESCPNCGSAVKKLISNTSFKLVGSGWYLTDYARKGTPSDDGKGAKSSAATDSNSETKKDTSGDQKSTKEKDSAPPASST